MTDNDRQTPPPDPAALEHWAVAAYMTLRTLEVATMIPPTVHLMLSMIADQAPARVQEEGVRHMMTHEASIGVPFPPQMFRTTDGG